MSEGGWVEVLILSWNYMQEHTITDTSDHKMTRTFTQPHTASQQDYLNQIVSLFPSGKNNFWLARGRPKQLLASQRPPKTTFG